MKDVIIESKSVSSPVAFTSAVAIEVQAIMEMVLSLLGVHSDYRLHMFNSLFFMKNQRTMNMFVANNIMVFFFFLVTLIDGFDKICILIMI